MKKIIKEKCWVGLLLAGLLSPTLLMALTTSLTYKIVNNTPYTYSVVAVKNMPNSPQPTQPTSGIFKAKTTKLIPLPSAISVARAGEPGSTVTFKIPNIDGMQATVGKTTAAYLWIEVVRTGSMLVSKKGVVVPVADVAYFHWAGYNSGKKQQQSIDNYVKSAKSFSIITSCNKTADCSKSEADLTSEPTQLQTTINYPSSKLIY